MKIHKMKLQPLSFDEIKAGRKTIEIRLLDDKRKLVKAGDNIVFYKNPNLDDNVKVRVEKIQKFKNFNELVNNVDVKLNGNIYKTKKDWLSDLRNFYPKEKEENLGVVCFYILLIFNL